MNQPFQIKQENFSGLQESQPKHKDFLHALILGKHSLCSELVHAYLAEQVSIKELYGEIITKALYDVGELWEYNKISVATEHLASAIVEAILNQLYFEIISKEKKGKTVIAACVENEFHQIGIKMISDIFEMNGWNALFLGSNTPTSELISFIRLKNPDLLAISLSLYFHLPDLEKMIQKVQKEFPKLPILVGGQAFQHGGTDIILKYDNVVFKPDLNSTEIFIKNFK
jgi:methanogenic corrinoid protein MtbC1